MNVYQSTTKAAKPSKFVDFLPLPILSLHLGQNSDVVTFQPGKREGLNRFWLFDHVEDSPDTKQGDPTDGRAVPNDAGMFYWTFQFRFNIPSWIADQAADYMPFRLRIGFYFNNKFLDDSREPVFTVDVAELASSVVMMPSIYSAMGPLSFFRTQIAGIVRKARLPKFVVSLDSLVKKTWAPNRFATFDFRITTDWEFIIAGAFDEPGVETDHRIVRLPRTTQTISLFPDMRPPEEELCV